MSSIVKIAKIAPSSSIVYQFLVFFTLTQRWIKQCWKGKDKISKIEKGVEILTPCCHFQPFAHVAPVAPVAHVSHVVHVAHASKPKWFLPLASVECPQSGANCQISVRSNVSQVSPCLRWDRAHIETLSSVKTQLSGCHHFGRKLPIFKRLSLSMYNLPSGM